MNKNIAGVSSLLSCLVLVGCHSGAGSTSNFGTSNSVNKYMSESPIVHSQTVAEFMQRVDPASGKVIVKALSNINLRTDKYPTELGSANFSLNDVTTPGQSCIANLDKMKVKYGQVTRNIEYSKNLTSKDMQNMLGISGSIKGNVGAFNGNIDGQYLDKTVATETSITYNFIDKFSALLTLENTPIAEPKSDLTKYLSGKKPSSDDIKSFYSICGDRYVTQINAGAYLATSVKIAFKSTLAKNLFDATVGAQIESIGSVSAAVQKFNEDSSNSEDVSISLLQVGGRPENLANIFKIHQEGIEKDTAVVSDSTQNYNIIECSAAKMNACLGILQSTAEYSKSDFAKQVTNGDEYVNLATFGSPVSWVAYDAIYPNATPLINSISKTNVSNDVSQLLTYKKTDEALSEFVNNYLNVTGLSRKLTTSLKTINSKLAARLNFYNQNSSKIITDCLSGNANLYGQECSAVLQSVKNLRVGTTNISSTEVNTLEDLLSNGYLAGKSLSTAGMLLYPVGIANENAYNVVPLNNFAIISKGFDGTAEVTRNTKLTINAYFTNGSDEISVNNVTPCSKSGTSYNCKKDNFDITVSGADSSKEAELNKATETAFTALWSADQNWYLSIPKTIDNFN